MLEAPYVGFLFRCYSNPNKYWLMEFRDEQSRPARHTLMYDSLPGDIVIQCDALAFVSNHD